MADEIIEAAHHTERPRAQLDHYEKALSIWRAAGSPPGFIHAKLLRLCGERLSVLGDDDAAFRYASQAIDAGVTFTNRDAAIERGLSLLLQGMVYTNQARDTQASISFREALTLGEQFNDAEVEVRALLGLARNQTVVEPNAALLLLERATKASSRTGAQPRVDLERRIQSSMGSALSALHRYDEALRCRLGFLAGCERDCGLNSMRIIPALDNVADTYVSLRDFPAAAAALLRAKSICELNEESDSVLFGTILARLSYVALARADAATAVSQSRAALALFKRQLLPGSDHPDKLLASFVLGKASGILGLTKESKAASNEADASLRRVQNRCAAPGCAARLRPDGAPLDQCAGCLRTYYCSVACQTADWKAGHKKECKVLAAESAVAAAAGRVTAGKK